MREKGVAGKGGMKREGESRERGEGKKERGKVEIEGELKLKKANFSLLRRNTVTANPHASRQLGGKIHSPSTISSHPEPLPEPSMAEPIPRV